MINAVVLHSEYLPDAVIMTRPSTEQALSSQRREDCSFPPAPRKNNTLIKMLRSKINPVSNHSEYLSDERYCDKQIYN